MSTPVNAVDAGQAIAVTTGQAYEMAKGWKYGLSQGRFRAALRNPDDEVKLVKFGFVSSDRALRAENPKSNAIKWLVWRVPDAAD